MSLETVSPIEAKRLIDRGARLIDVRGADEHAREWIPKACNRPLNKLAHLDASSTPSSFIAARVIELPPTQRDWQPQQVAALKREGFGVLTDIDVKATLKSKLGEDFRPYRILGACNPQLAYRALKLEDKIGTMLPCNVIVQEHAGGDVEISVVDPVASCRQSRTWSRRDGEGGPGQAQEGRRRLVAPIL